MLDKNNSMDLIKKIIPGLLIGLFIIGGFIIYSDRTNNEANSLSSQEAAQKALKFINENMLQGAAQASLMEVVKESGVYKIKIGVEEEEFDSYVSIDGNLLFVNGINIEEEQKKIDEAKEASKPAKTDNPDVKLFVMSYCPYGLQAQKALLPVMDLLGDKASIGVYFVDYIMHDKKEIDENLRQYCIQKEEEDKYINYLSCFVVAGETESCLTQAGINRSLLSSCIAEADAEFGVIEGYNDKSTWLNGVFPLFNIHTDLNKQFGVSGSPALVINGKIVNPSDRSPEAFKNIICEAFNSAPGECQTALSEEAASPSFGTETGGSSSGSCE